MNTTGQYLMAKIIELEICEKSLEEQAETNLSNYRKTRKEIDQNLKNIKVIKHRLKKTFPDRQFFPLHNNMIIILKDAKKRIKEDYGLNEQVMQQCLSSTRTGIDQTWEKIKNAYYDRELGR